MAKSEILNNDALTVRLDTEALTTAVETAVNVVDDQVEHIVTVTKSNPLILVAALAVGLGIGGFIAYKVAVKRTQARYELIVTEEVEAAKHFYARINKNEYPTPESAVQALVPEDVSAAVNSYQGRQKVAYNRPDTLVEEVVETVEITKNVFTSGDSSEWAAEPDGWDYDTEMANRQEFPDKPYVIKSEEFLSNEENHEQVTLTFYRGDDTLTDEREDPIDNQSYTVGEDNLDKFGYGSGDENIVYIRNLKLGMDFEIILNKGKYHEEVLGMHPSDTRDLKHSTLRHPNRGVNQARKFRGTDG